MMDYDMKPIECKICGTVIGFELEGNDKIKCICYECADSLARDIKAKPLMI